MSSNHHITLQEAIDLTQRYQANRPTDFFISETFPATVVQELLDEPGCAYLRIYLGRKPDDSVVTVLVGANDSEADILPTGDADNATAVILEDGFRCPQFCPPPSSLHT